MVSTMSKEKKNIIRKKLVPKSKENIQLKEREDITKKQTSSMSDHDKAKLEANMLAYHKKYHQKPQNYPKEIKKSDINSYTKKIADKSDIFIPEDIASRGKKSNDIIDNLIYTIEKSSFAKYFRGISNTIDQKSFHIKNIEKNNKILSDRETILKNLKPKIDSYHKDIKKLSDIMNGKEDINNIEATVKQDNINQNIIGTDKEFIQLPREDGIPKTWFITRKIDINGKKVEIDFLLKMIKSGKEYNSTFILSQDQVDKLISEKIGKKTLLQQESQENKKRIEEEIQNSIKKEADTITEKLLNIYNNKETKFLYTKECDFIKLKNIEGEHTLKSLLIQDFNYSTHNNELPRMLDKNAELKSLLSQDKHIINKELSSIFNDGDFSKKLKSPYYIPIEDSIIKNFTETMTRISKDLEPRVDINDENLSLFQPQEKNVIRDTHKYFKNIKRVFSVISKSLFVIGLAPIITTIISTTSIGIVSPAIPVCIVGIYTISAAIIGTVVAYIIANFQKHRMDNSIEKQKIQTLGYIDTAIKTLNTLDKKDHNNIQYLQNLKKSVESEAEKTKKSIKLKSILFPVVLTISVGLLSIGALVAILSSPITSSIAVITLAVILPIITLVLARFSLKKISHQLGNAQVAMSKLDNSCASTHKIVDKNILNTIYSSINLENNKNVNVEVFHQTAYITILKGLLNTKSTHPKDKDINNFIEKFAFFLNKTNVFKDNLVASRNPGDNIILKKFGIDTDGLHNSDAVIEKIFGNGISNDIYQQFIHATRSAIAEVYLAKQIEEGVYGDTNSALEDTIAKFATCKDEDILKIIQHISTQYQDQNVEAKSLGTLINDFIPCHNSLTEDRSMILKNLLTSTPRTELSSISSELLRGLDNSCISF